MNEELTKDFWTQVNEIEQLSCKVNSCQSIIAICAERALGDDSGALWAASDILNDIESKLDDRVHNLLMIYRQLQNPVKKAKKK
jgi:hypothetical protein